MINRFLRWTGLIILLFVLQTTVIPLIAIFGIKPDLILLVLCFVAFKTDVVPALFIGFFLGLVQDFYAPEILGLNALAKTIAGFFAGIFNEKVMRIDPIFQLTLIFLTFLLHDLVYFTVQLLKSELSFHYFGIELVTSTLPRACYTLVFALIPTYREYLLPTGKR